jgi:P27 family predicted phage terminase small subunit
VGSSRGPGGGRKPKPTILKMLAGNPGRRPLNPNEPEPKRRIPPCPEVLQGEARKEWRRIAKKLFEAGLLTEIDGPALMGYCLAYGRLLDAEQKLRDFGSVAKAPSGYLVHSPYLAIANKALEQMRAFLVEFGMTPSSRSRVQAAGGVRRPAPEGSDIDERFFGSGTG